MKFQNRVLQAMLFVLAVFLVPQSRAQTKAQEPAGKPAATPEADAHKKNMDAYLALMRRDIRQEKAEIMGATMALSAQDAAKFWPIYSEYDAELAKLNDQRVANIKEYAQNYAQLTDEEADKLVQKSMAYQKQRSELLAQTYEKVKQALGGVTAARFAMVEHQILTIIDLQITASLPIAGQSM
jgi:glutamyl/glutaminyl-tRNA synthetase